MGFNEGYESADARSRQQLRPSLPLGRLYRGAAPRDRAGERAAPGADAAGHQHQPGAAKSRRDEPQPRTRGGPFTPGLNEYTPLFERNDIQFVGAGIAGRGDRLEFDGITPAPTGLDGKEDTLGFEGIASALYDRFSISAGAFDYDTDGWRPNAGFEHEIKNFFMQAAVTPDLNVQVEVRHREISAGRLGLQL